MNKNLRVSSYETVLPLPKEKEKALAFNGLYGSADIITAEEAGIMEESKKQAVLLRSLSDETAKRLVSRGHLVDVSPETELENVRIMSRVHWLIPYRKFLDIVVMPTYNCNFRCPYCFERQRLERGQEWLSRTMPDDILQALFRQIDELQRSGIVIRRVILYGGEPLLRSNRKQVVQILDACRKRHIHLACVTNGYDLDAFLDFIPKEETDFLQITVDGPAPVHDSRRFPPGGRGSFEKIMENIGAALKQDIPVNIRTNVNRKNLKDAPALMEEYRKRGFDRYPHFNYYFKATLGCFEDDSEDAVSDEEVFHEILRQGLSREEAVRVCRVHSAVALFAAGAFSEDAYPVMKPSFCGAHSDMLVVDPGGDLYACWDVVADETQTVGFLDPGSGRFLYNFAYPKWRTRTVDNMPDCAGCPLLMQCGGGCAIESEGSYGDRFRGFCGSIREAFSDVMPYACEAQYEKTGKLSLSHSFYDLFGTVTEEERKILLKSTDSGEVWRLMKAHMNRAEKIFS